ncbi:MAG: NAD(+) synthase [Thermodesulfobacteriota bacterium]
MKTDKVINHIVGWLLDYCEKAGVGGYVIGVSGGIDSAVTSTLCARTGKKVMVLNLPILQDPGQVSLAQSHIRWLTERFSNVASETIDLSGVFQVFARAIPDDTGDELTMANTRSRLRMTALYAMATHFKLLVAGTGNKVEDFGVGFFTKYGDGGVDISPIADLMKTEVYELARHMGILQKIIDVPPTDGLWTDSRTDESQIGASYPELEWAMTADITTPEKEAALSDRQREVLSIFRRFNRANRHKMEPIPVCRIPDNLR